MKWNNGGRECVSGGVFSITFGKNDSVLFSFFFFFGGREVLVVQAWCLKGALGRRLRESVNTLGLQISSR